MKIDKLERKVRKIGTRKSTNRKRSAWLNLRINRIAHNNRKGLVQVDFIVAAALFIVVFGLIVQLVTNYFTTAESTAEINTLTGEALSLLGVADFGYTPDGWSSSGDVDRLGLASRAYRLYIAVDNSKPFYLNQSQNATDLTNELVSFLYSDLGFANIDTNSTEIYESGARVPYNINGNNITFRTDISANTAKTFTVYFDDDSNFTSRSAGIDGNNTITETVHFVQPISVLQYRKMQTLNASNYTAVRNSLGVNDFSLLLEDTDTNPVSAFFFYGGEAPRSGNVIALPRHSIFQNSTAGIRNGKITVKTW